MKCVNDGKKNVNFRQSLSEMISAAAFANKATNSIISLSMICYVGFAIKRKLSWSFGMNCNVSFVKKMWNSLRSFRQISYVIVQLKKRNLSGSFRRMSFDGY